MWLSLDGGELKIASIYKLSVQEGPRAYQLVGEVTAHQGGDG